MCSPVFFNVPSHECLVPAILVRVKQFVLRFAKDISRQFRILPTFIGLVFATPTIIFHRDDVTNEIFETELRHPSGYVKGWNLGFTAHHTLRWSRIISNMNLAVLSEKNFMMLYEIVDGICKKYKHGFHYWDIWGSSGYSDKAQLEEALDHLIRHSLQLLTGASAKR